MKKFLLSLSMCLLAIAANAQTAGENPAINIEEEVFYFWEDGMESANSVKFADGATTTITGNSEKTVSSGSDITVGDKAYKSMKVSNGSENTFVAPAGKTPVQVTFYSYINKAAGDTDRTTFWAEVDGQTFTAETGTVHKSFKDGANPDIVTFNLAGNSSFTYTNKGDQVCYVMKVAYGTISGGSTETQTPLITLTVEAEAIGKARTFEFGSGVADNKISIDWGDGNIVDGATIAGVYDGWTTTQVTGKPVGSGEIKIYATGGTFDMIDKAGIKAEKVKKLYEGRPNIGDMILNRDVDLVINTPAGKTSAHDDSYIRKDAIRQHVPYITTMAAAKACAEGIKAAKERVFEVKALQDYHADIK